METPTLHERPLTPGRRLLLVIGAVIAISGFYLFALACVVVMVCVLAIELLLFIGLLRFGLAGYIGRVIARHVALLTLLLRSFWIQRGAESRIVLSPEEAPQLFRLLEALGKRLGIPPPQEVSLEMNVTAWVRLAGFRQGEGKTTLGIGFDLLAGLTEAEVEAVLAHEMTHAKLVRRGLSRWLSAGLVREARMTTALANRVATARTALQQADLDVWILEVADRLTRWSSRLIATYSRQSEFDADRGAVELCGPAAFRSALLKLEALSEIAVRLPLAERIAQLQHEEGFSQWLTRELAAATSGSTADRQAKFEAHNRYSTHPRMADRLAALPLPGEKDRMPESKPALALLRDPDSVAQRLVHEIERVFADQEERDSTELRTVVRRARRGASLRPLQWLGILLMVVGGILGFVCLASRQHSAFDLVLILIAVAGLVGGVLVYRRSRYRDRQVLPVPEYARLKDSWQHPAVSGDVAAKEAALEREFQQNVAAEKGRRRQVQSLVAASHAALAQCDFLPAHVAARLALARDRNSVEARLAYAVASSALGLGESSIQALGAVERATGYTSPSTAWGGAWTLLLVGNLGFAEVLIEQAREAWPESETLLALLAITRARRGKMLSALRCAREACALAPADVELNKLMIQFLIDTGQVREAAEQIAKFDLPPVNDPELIVSFVRLRLLQRNFADADRWTAQLQDGTVAPTLWIRLAAALETARRLEAAETFYHRALGAGFYPEAYLGLSRLAARRDDRTRAKAMWTAALNLTLPPGRGSVGVPALFRQALDQGLSLVEPILGCQAWTVKFGPTTPPPALSQRTLLIYALDAQGAGAALDRLLRAMQPATPPAYENAFEWKLAPRRLQPDGPVRPGVQAVLS